MTQEKLRKVVTAVTVAATALLVFLLAVIVYQVVTMCVLTNREKELEEEFKIEVLPVVANGGSEEDVKNVIASISGRAIAGRMQEFLQSVFNYAIEMGYVKCNPVSGLKKVQQNRRVRPLNRAGLQRLFNIIDAMDNIVMRGAFLMLIYGFAPRSKIFSMAWEDLDFNHDMWLTHPLSDRAIVLLQDMPQDGQWVFPGRGGMHMTDPRTAWRRVAQQAGIPNLKMDDVYKFLMRQVAWAADKEDLRGNFNALLDDIFLPSID